MFSPGCEHFCPAIAFHDLFTRHVECGQIAIISRRLAALTGRQFEPLVPLNSRFIHSAPKSPMALALTEPPHLELCLDITAFSLCLKFRVFSFCFELHTRFEKIEF